MDHFGTDKVNLILNDFGSRSVQSEHALGFAERRTNRFTVIHGGITQLGIAIQDVD